MALLYGIYFAATGAASPCPVLRGDPWEGCAVVLGLGCFSEDLEQALVQLYVQGTKPLHKHARPTACSLFLLLAA